MTREEEIIQTAKQKEKEVGFTQIVKDTKGVNSAYGIGFLEGAEWADNHPNLTLKGIVKEVDLDDKDEWQNTGGFGSTYDPDSPDYYKD